MLSQGLVPEPDPDRRGYFARNCSSILESGAMRFPVSSEIFKGTHFTAIAFYKTFLFKHCLEA